MYAIPFLKRAIEIDPNFALAHAHLGLWYSGIGESTHSMESTRKAYQLRDRVSDREKFFIALNYDRQVTGNLEKAQQTAEVWEQTYPRDTEAYGLLSGFTSQGSGKYEKSIEEAKRAIALDPDFTPGYADLAFSNFYLDRTEAYLAPSRLKLGAEILQSTEDSVAEVATTGGYGSEAAFNHPASAKAHSS